MAGPLRLRVALAAVLAFSTSGGLLSAPAAIAEPQGVTAAERRFLAEADQYLPRLRPTEVVVLKLGQQACQVRRSGGSSDDAKVAIWKTWNASGIGPAPGAVLGSLVHVAVDNICPEVGYAVTGSSPSSPGRSESYEIGYESCGGREWAINMLTNQSPDEIAGEMYELRSARIQIADKNEFLLGCRDGLMDAVK